MLTRLLLFTCYYVVSVWRGFLFLFVLGMGYVILLWHSLSLPFIILDKSFVCIIVTFINYQLYTILGQPSYLDLCIMYFWPLGIRHLWPPDFWHVSRYFRIVLKAFLFAAKLFSFLHSTQTVRHILFFVALIHTRIFFLNCLFIMFH